ncbi:cytochrome P450 [Streptomyces umbrinus]|uniref:Cytochrome P450 n=1 Tax=Streptomyces umbrinus TaxID=67370 RepID=A0ABU0SMF7_9ACTN|nr:cytochrome P450 [Streptomyces umbrinus]MDQ1024733.1 cytochrome P450 [Streptomyces umbrinus]
MRKDELLGVWVVTGFADVSRLLMSPALSSAWPAQGTTELHSSGSCDRESRSRTSDTVRRWFMFKDGGGHATLRKLMAPVFTTERISQVRPYVEGVVAELLAAHDTDDVLDVMADLAIPLSSRVICHVLGLSESVAPQLHGWAQDIAALLIADYQPEVVRRGDRALREIEDVIEEALDCGEARETSGLRVLQHAVRDGLIDQADVPATASLLVYAGYETTSTFIGKAVRALIHSGKWRSLNHQATSSTVEELLRFDTSVQQVARIAAHSVTVGGQRIEAGDLVLLMLGAANRDESLFAEPDVLSPGRSIPRQLTFGQGPHYCLGAGLARLETEVVLAALAARWTSVRLAAPPVTRSHNGVNMLESLKIRVEPC